MRGEMMRRFLPVAVVLVLALVAAAALLATPDVDPAEMARKYGGPASRFAETEEGLKLHYRDDGNPDGATIVLLHGTNASLHTFEKVVERLGGDYRIISLDFPAHGLSGAHPRGDYSARGYMEAVDAVVAAAGAETFTLGGNSLGGWTAGAFAVAHPQKAEKIVLVDAAGYSPKRWGGPPLDRAQLNGLNPSTTAQMKATFSLVFHNKAMASDAFAEQAFTAKLKRGDGGTINSFIESVLREEDLLDETAKTIKAPTLVLWGRQDGLTPLAMGELFAKEIPGAQLVVIDQCGHVPQMEKPAEFNAALLRFLAGARATAAK